MTQKIHPIGFSGTRAATTAPTPAYASDSSTNDAPPTPPKRSSRSDRPGPATSNTSVPIADCRAHRRSETGHPAAVDNGGP